MIGFQVVARYTGPDKRLTTNITDLEAHYGTRGWTIYSATDQGGGIQAYRLNAVDKMAARISSAAYPNGLAHFDSPQLGVVDMGGREYLLQSGLTNAISRAVSLDPAGGFGNWTNLSVPNGVFGRLVALESFSIGGRTFLAGTSDGTAGLTIYRQGASGAPVSVSRTVIPESSGFRNAEIDHLSVVTRPNSAYVAGVSTLGNFITLSTIGGDGTILNTRVLDTRAGSGFSQPRAVEVVGVDGTDYLVVSSGQSSSLTTIRLLPGGNMVAVDHVIDELDTRFRGATAMDVVTIDGRSFVFVGGADDGITVFTISPSGRLIHLRTIADADGITLASVSALKAVAIDGRIALFVASATENGLTQLVFDPGTIGVTRRVGISGVPATGGGDLLEASGREVGALSGGPGDDILITGGGSIKLTGGGGGDTFVVTPGRGKVLITDFQRGLDSIDLSQIPMLHSTAQLTIRATAAGAIISYNGLVIDVRGYPAGPIAGSYFGDWLFPAAHYQGIPVRVVLMGSYRNEVMLAPLKGGSLYGMGGNDRLRGNGLEDLLNGGTGNDSLFGLEGHDTLIGGAGNDLLSGAGGDDLLLGDQGDDRLLGGSGNDELRDPGGRNRMQGDAGNDTIRGGAHGDMIYGGEGDDLLLGGGGIDTIRGDAGNDKMLGGTGAGWQDGGAGNDSIWGGPAADTLFGGAGDDRILAGAGNDIVRDKSGQDTIYGGDGDDRLIGGTGVNRSFGGFGRDTIYGGGSDDWLDGQPDDDIIYGDDGNDTLFGGSGDDRLIGGAGRDRLVGGEGNDIIDGGPGNNTVQGGPGHDRIAGGHDSDYILGDDGNDTIQGRNGDDAIIGGRGDDVIAGEGGNDTINGQTGDDRIDGNAGDDVLVGGDGTDTLSGGSGRDLLSGGDQDDLIRGGAGIDTLTGGAGADVFIFDARNDAPMGDQTDYISDFDVTCDVVDLRALGLTMIGSGTFTAPDQLAIRPAENGYMLLADFDGDRNPDFAVYLSTNGPLTADNILC
ncbi:calcium-binding protein [Paracoccus pacificus]|uniref:Calcium-binding protein n=1 Tax=Paracoccus pacificus TaxID=1463598 RepID=A0ABW4R8J5_9RHOB